MMKLSIITINYNNADGLRKTIQSVLAQTHTEFEYVIVDGASTDGSIDVIKEMILQRSDSVFCSAAVKYSPMQVHWLSEPDNGIYNAMNKGIRMATGEYCLFLNSGDCLAHDRIIEEVFACGLAADIVSGNAILEKSKLHPESYHMSPETYRASDIILGSLPHQATFIRRSLFEEIHPYDEMNKVVSDWSFNIEALLIHHKKYQHIQLFVARCETDGVSSQPSNMTLIDEEFTYNVKKILPEIYDDFVELSKARKETANPQTLFMKKLQKTCFFHILWGLRKRLLHLGYYAWNNQRKQKQFFKSLIREDATWKKELLQKIEALPDNLLQYTTTDCVVSLTSYGKRMTDALPFALYSILTQTTLPKRIAVYCDYIEGKIPELPAILKTLEQKGVEFHFVEDSIRSFKKILPSLKMYPDDVIITIDDDIFYNPHTIEWLYESYLNSDKMTVLGLGGHLVEKINGVFVPYNQWRAGKDGNQYSESCLLGVCGVLYPPHIFDDEIFKKDIFMKLCPTADDLWLWAMERRLGIKSRLVGNHYGLKVHRYINRIEEYDLSQQNTLTYVNVTNGQNDEQFFKLVEKYHL